MSVELEQRVSDEAPALTRPKGLFEDLPRDTFEPEQDYRAVSTPAVASLALGVLSVLAMLDWWLAIVPIAGAILGIYALRVIGRSPEEYTGKRFAVLGIALSAVLLVVGLSYQSYVYATEVPPGYERISYEILQPEPESGLPVPAAIRDLDGKDVFIKGYVYPGEQQHGITRFMLVRDQGDCCFGGTPKETDRILVTLKDPRGFTFSEKRFKVAGRFRFEPMPAPAGMSSGGIFYHLDGAELR